MHPKPRSRRGKRCRIEVCTMARLPRTRYPRILRNDICRLVMTVEHLIVHYLALDLLHYHVDHFRLARCFVPLSYVIWLVPILIGFLAGGFIRLPFRFPSRFKYRPGHCENCGYDLRTSKDRCPECGQPLQKTTRHANSALDEEIIPRWRADTSCYRYLSTLAAASLEPFASPLLELPA